MKYKLIELIDINKIKKLIYEFNKLTGVPIGIFDTEGGIVYSAGIQQICIKFHRKNCLSRKVCNKADDSALKLVKERKQIQYTCPHGLIETFTPIIVKNEHIASLFIGQFLYEKPDIEYFKNQAINYGYDLDSYLKCLEDVPIISKEKIDNSRNFFLELAEMISDMAVSQLTMREAENLIIQHNENLELSVKERTEELIQLNCKLENDILLLKETENKLKESEERYKSLLTLFPYGIMVRDKSKVLFINNYGAKYIGFDNSEEVIGKKIEELFYPHPDYAEQFKNNLKIIEEKKGMPSTEERFFRKKDNKFLNVETTITSISYNGIESMLVVFRDISERKRIEKLKKKIEENTLIIKETLEYDRLRMEFFSNISHELKTPISVIFSAIQTANLVINQNHSGNNNKMNNYLQIMKQNCLRLIRLVNNLLDITKIDSGYLKVELVNCDIISTVENIVLSVAEYIKNKGIELIFDTEIEEKIMACDRDKIERIMLNLLSNATKFTQSGGKIFVDIKQEKNNMVISVKDTGIGVSLEKQKVIFERFVQVDKSLSRRQEGSGIGLSLVKSLVEMHKGKIYINSKYTKGCEFIIKLPSTIIENNSIEGDNKIEIHNYNNKTDIDKINVEFSDIYM